MTSKRVNTRHQNVLVLSMTTNSGCSLQHLIYSVQGREGVGVKVHEVRQHAFNSRVSKSIV